MRTPTYNSIFNKKHTVRRIYVDKRFHYVLRSAVEANALGELFHCELVCASAQKSCTLLFTSSRSYTGTAAVRGIIPGYVVLLYAKAYSYIRAGSKAGIAIR